MTVDSYAPPDPFAHPSLDWPAYRSTALRHPKRPLVPLPHMLGEVTGPALGESRLGPLDHDLTRQHEGEPLGERIIVHGRVLDGSGRPLPNTLVEVWQANAAGATGTAATATRRRSTPTSPAPAGWSPAPTAATGS
jgi:protocatechuate 3,4-dioxygenase beta subunit